MKMSLKMRPAATMVILLAAFGFGCSEESPKKVPMQFVKNEKVKDSGDSTQSFNRAVDILFVVDDSGSMSTHQANLAKNVKLFTQGITNNQILDYHIGVVTSNMDTPSGSWRGPVPGFAYKGELWGQTKFVTRTTPNGSTILEQNLQPGTEGSATEMFFAPVQAALSAPLVNGANVGFYRPDAFLVVIFLTDADDQSTLSAPGFHQWLLSQKGGDPEKIITYGVYIPTVDQTCTRQEDVPTKLELFFKLSSANTLGLCDPDFGTQLATLGDDLARRVGGIFYLTRPAQPDTITVRFGTQTIPNDPRKGWTFDPVRNGLLFGEEMDLLPEPPDTKLIVDFTAAEY